MLAFLTHVFAVQNWSAGGNQANRVASQVCIYAKEFLSIRYKDMNMLCSAGSSVLCRVGFILIRQAEQVLFFYLHIIGSSGR